MPIPKVYAKPGADAIASYNFTDISDGTGVVNFLGYMSQASSAAIVYKLGNQTIFSQLVNYAGTIVTTFDFNLTPFNKPQIVKGTCTCRFSAGSLAGVGHTIWFDAVVKKVARNGTETIIGTGSTRVIDLGASSVFANLLCSFDLTTTKFKVGESLRLTIIPYRSDVAVTTLYLGFDPANRDGVEITPASTYPTKMELFIPFKIDV